MAELKPCPFCGGEARIAVGGDNKSFSVHCSNVYTCGATQFLFDTEAEAIEAWERRDGGKESAV